MKRSAIVLAGIVLLSSAVFAQETPSLITAQVNITPDTLNLKSGGKWITCRIQLPTGYKPADIDVATVLVGTVATQKTGVKGKALLVKFSRAGLIAYVQGLGVTPPIDVVLTVTGSMKDGTSFLGADTVRVISPGKGKKK